MDLKTLKSILAIGETVAVEFIAQNPDHGTESRRRTASAG